MPIKKDAPVHLATQKNLLLQNLLAQGLRVFTNGTVKDIAIRLNISKVYTNIILSSLIQEGWLRDIRKGLYAFTSTAGIHPIHEFEIAMQLVKPTMISHYSAFYYHELTDQVPLALALAQEWCMQGRKVHYTTAAQLLQNLLKAKAELKLNTFIKKLDYFAILTIDDISYIPCTKEETDVLFTLLSMRYEMRSVMVTSNLAFANWDQIFKDKMTTAAAIDRLVHHSHILELNAESYRIATAKKSRKNPGQDELSQSNITG